MHSDSEWSNQGECLTLLLFKLAFIRNVQKNKEGLELKRTHQLLVHADDVNL
jgi:hypothetical protein